MLLLQIQSSSRLQTVPRTNQNPTDTLRNDILQTMKPMSLKDPPEFSRGKITTDEESFHDEVSSIPAKRETETDNVDTDSVSMEEDPPKKTAKAPKKKKREINPDFKDVEQTGSWGKIEKKEIYMVLAFMLVLVIAAVITAVVLLTGNNKSETPSAALTTITTPTTMTQELPSNTTSPAKQLAAIRLATEDRLYLQDSFALLPEDPGFYIDKWADTAQLAQVRAASWIMFVDPLVVDHTSSWLLPRYALAVLYFGTTGSQWNNHTNWLTSDHCCYWYGVTCDRWRQWVEALDLTKNNVVGRIPHEINFFDQMIALTLSNNQLTGSLPSEQLGNMAHLSILYLDNNQLTGAVSVTIVENNALSKYFESTKESICYYSIVASSPIFLST